MKMSLLIISMDITSAVYQGARTMNTLTRRIGVALTVALLATTAIAPMASAQGWQGNPRDWHGGPHRRSGNNAGLVLGLGIAAIAGIALLSTADHAPQPVYQPAYPAYPQPAYRQPAYTQPAYGQPSCTTINGAAACLSPDGAWHYVR
jgi:hypothetical protein